MKLKSVNDTVYLNNFNFSININKVVNVYLRTNIELEIYQHMLFNRNITLLIADDYIEEPVS